MRYILDTYVRNSLSWGWQILGAGEQKQPVLPGEQEEAESRSVYEPRLQARTYALLCHHTLLTKHKLGVKFEIFKIQ